MAEVTFAGLGARNGFGNANKDVVYDGVGKPVFEAGESRLQSSATNFVTNGRESILGAPHTSFPDAEIQDLGFGPINAPNPLVAGGVSFPDAEVQHSDGVDEFNTTGKDVTRYSSKGWLNLDGTTFYGPAVIGPTYPTTNDK